MRYSSRLEVSEVEGRGVSERSVCEELIFLHDDVLCLT